MAQFKYGTAPKGTPMSDQSFGTQRAPEAPVNMSQNMNVPGVGVMGPDMGGAVAGDQARRAEMLKQNADSRAEEELGMSKVKLGMDMDYLAIAQADLGIRQSDSSMRLEKFSWEKADRETATQRMNDMSAASQAGGYNGVIEYLKKVDPKSAIEFHGEKLKLDNAIMNNEVMQATAPNEKNKAMLESYSILGKMSQGILSAKPEDRENMYKGMQPILQKVMGDNVPATLKEFTPIGMLAIAQSMPESQIFGAQQQSVLMQTDIGKTSAALADLAAKGLTPDNDQTAADLAGRLAGIRAKDYKAQAEITSLTAAKNAAEMSREKNQGVLRSQQMNADKDMSKRYLVESKDTGEFLTQKQNFDSAYATWDEAKKNGQGQQTAETAMIRSVGMMFNKGTFSDADAAAFAGSDSGLLQLVRRTRSQYEATGGIVANPKEIGRLKSLMDNMAEVKQKTQEDINSRYKEMEGQYNITPNAIRYYDLAPKAKPAPAAMGVAQLQQEAAKAIAGGADPKAVQAQLQQLMASQQGQ